MHRSHSSFAATVGHILFAGIAAVSLLHCAKKQKVDEPFERDLDVKASQRVPPAPIVQTLPPVFTREGAIGRAALQATLASGPAQVLRYIEVDNVGGGAKFNGWRLIRYLGNQNDTMFAGVDLQPGDVLWTINGKVIERPEHLQALWDSLPAATEIRASLMRGDVPFELVYTIIPDETAPGTTSTTTTTQN